MNGQKYCGAIGPAGVCPVAGQSVNWISTLSFVTATGWKVCWDYGSTSTLTTHYSLLTTHYSLLTTYYSLQVCWDYGSSECPALEPEGSYYDAGDDSDYQPPGVPVTSPMPMSGGVPSTCSPEVRLEAKP